MNEQSNEMNTKPVFMVENILKMDFKKYNAAHSEKS